MKLTKRVERLEEAARGLDREKDEGAANAKLPLEEMDARFQELQHRAMQGETDARWRVERIHSLIERARARRNETARTVTTA